MPGVVTREQFLAARHPNHKKRFILALSFSILLFPAILAGLVFGTIILVVPALALLLWISSRVYIAYVIGNCILVSDLNYPRIHNLKKETQANIGYEKHIYVFVTESPGFNMFLSYLFFRRAVFLPSEVLAPGVTDDEIRWMIGRFVGYLRARREAGFWGWVIHAAEYLIVFNLFLLPYQRAMVLTGDRLGLVSVQGDISCATSALQKLMVGREMGYSINPEGIFSQFSLINGTFVSFLSRLFHPFPHSVYRYVDLIFFSKEYARERFDEFRAANPGLPESFSIAPLSDAQVSSNDQTSNQGEQAQVRRDIRIGGAIALSLCGLILLGAIVLGIFSATKNNSSQNSYQNNFPMQALPPTLPNQDPLPPHTHRNAAGHLEPNRGCVWLNNDENDLRVRCQ